LTEGAVIVSKLNPIKAVIKSNVCSIVPALIPIGRNATGAPAS